MYTINEIRNKIIYGDNIEEMRKIPDNSVDLVYLDPPFFSGKNYEIIWGDKDEIRSFEDRFKGGIEVYLAWVQPRIKEMHRILKSTGSIYLHCDWHASHYLKIEMDKIFGYGNFQNEIVWCYSGGGVPKTAFARKHDIILVYSKTDTKDRLFNIQYMPYSKASTKLITARGGISVDGKVRDLERGAHMNDWWTDINALQTWSPEKQGYPTQKPEALLERIIKASSNEGDLIFDPFCGCGTTAAVAKRLKRNFIGIDVSLIACELISKRTGASILGIPITNEMLLAMKPHEFQQWVCTKMSAKNTNPNGSEAASGADGIIWLSNQKGKLTTDNSKINQYDGCPLEVKQHKSSIGVDVIHKLFSVLSMDFPNKKDAFIVALSFGKGAYEMVAKLKNSGKADIHLIKAEELLKFKNDQTYMDNLISA